jgi:C4-dicarboxylate-specific signal transduction histidine kinase
MANLDAALHLEAGAGRGGPDDPGEILKDARQAAERMRQMIRDLRIHAASEREPEQLVDVDSTVELAARVAARQIGLVRRVVKQLGAPPPVRGSRSRLAHAFLELMLWATRHGARGSALPDLLLATRATDAEVVIEIGCDGAPLPPELQRRFLTPYVLGVPALVGHAVALASCRAVIVAHGGRIEALADEGARVQLVLPRADRAPAPLA